jgi:preprotein translocase subunit SecY
VIAFIVFMERAHSAASLCNIRNARSGNKLMGGETNHIPLKLNTSGVIPAIFASSLLLAAADGCRFYGRVKAAISRNLRVSFSTVSRSICCCMDS